MSIRDRLSPWLENWGIENASQLDEWIEGMRPLSVAAGDVVVGAGEPGTRIYLVEAGLVRLFYTTPDGKERNKAFFEPGQVTGAVSAALTGSAAPFSIDALEPSVLIRADFATLLRLAEHHIDVSRLFSKLLAEAFIRNEQREAMLLTCNAEQRYRWLLERQPGLVGRVPQFHLASYLGVDAVSLSRLKRKLDNDANDAPV